MTLKLKEVSLDRTGWRTGFGERRGTCRKTDYSTFSIKYMKDTLPLSYTGQVPNLHHPSRASS
jgi:hypothetical protein